MCTLPAFPLQSHILSPHQCVCALHSVDESRNRIKLCLQLQVNFIMKLCWVFFFDTDLQLRLSFSVTPSYGIIVCHFSVLGNFILCPEMRGIIKAIRFSFLWKCLFVWTLTLALNFFADSLQPVPFRVLDAETLLSAAGRRVVCVAVSFFSGWSLACSLVAWLWQTISGRCSLDSQLSDFISLGTSKMRRKSKNEIDSCPHKTLALTKWRRVIR